MTKRFGFTLAEVLITLGIIGVVAAMTMPTLMNSTNGAQYKAAYKKALSAISQAVTLNVALDEFDFADTTTTEAVAGAQSIFGIIQSRMNVVRTAEGSIGYEIDDNGTGFNVDKDSNYTLFFSDGSALSFAQGASACTVDSTKGDKNKCFGIIDVNGQKKPNKVVKCDSGVEDTCEVKSPTDVYPIMMYDSQILPASDAARATLYAK